MPRDSAHLPFWFNLHPYRFGISLPQSASSQVKLLCVPRTAFRDGLLIFYVENKFGGVRNDPQRTLSYSIFLIT
jgi:hypothetical protein